MGYKAVRYHDEHGRRYVGAFAASAGSAVIANAVLGGGFQVQEWSQQNLVVVPMLVIAIIATVFVHNRLVQYGAGVGLLGIWTHYFSILQASLS